MKFKLLVFVLIALVMVGGVLLWTAAPDDQAGDSAVDVYEDALRRFNQEQYQGALVQLRNVLAKAPAHLAAQLLLGRTHLMLNEPAAAEKYLRSAWTGGADPELVLPYLAESFLLQGKHRPLIEVLGVRDLSGTDEGLAYLVRGDAHLAMGDTAAAELNYEFSRRLRPEDHDPVYGLARVALERENPGIAEDLVELILEEAPDNAAAWYLKGELRRSKQDPAGALEAYGRALSLEPGSIAGQNARAAVLYQMERDHEALEQLEAVLEAAPDDPEARYIKALVLARRAEMDGARESMREALRFLDGLPPELVASRPRAQFLLGIGHFAEGNFDKARVQLERYVEADDSNARALKFLGMIYLEQGEPDRAMSVLARASSVAEDDVEIHALLGEAYSRERYHTLAAQSYERAAAIAGDPLRYKTDLALTKLAAGDREGALADLEDVFAQPVLRDRAGFILGLLRVQDKDYSGALELAELMAAARPESPLPYHLQGMVGMLEGRSAEARAQLETALRKAQDFLPASLLLARLDLAAGDIQAARGRYQHILERAPESRDALVGISRAAELDGDLGVAIKHMETLIATAAEQPADRRRLATLRLRFGQPEEALALVEALIKEGGSTRELLDLKTRAHLAAGQPREAAKSLRLMSGLAVDMPERLLEVATLQVAALDTAGAKLSLERALAADPEQAEAQMAMGVLAIRAGQWEEARHWSEDLKASRPDHAAGWVLEGDILAKTEGSAAAREAYGEAFARQADGALARKLFEARLNAGLREEAFAGLEAWLEEHPDDLAAQRALSEGYMYVGEFVDAIALQRSILEGRPDDPMALRGLAEGYRELGDPRALDYAERAMGLAPDDAGVLDTLGWTLVERGQLARGLTYLRQAQARDGNNPRFRHHIGITLLRMGREGEARTEFRAIQRLAPDFVLAEEARAALDEPL